MARRVAYSATHNGAPMARIFADYSEAAFRQMFTAQDQATLTAGGTVVAKADPGSKWQADVEITEPAKQGGHFE